jgi:hypothetical protein
MIFRIKNQRFENETVEKGFFSQIHSPDAN